MSVKHIILFILILSIIPQSSAALNYVNINSSADINDTVIVTWNGADEGDNWGAHPTTKFYGVANYTGGTVHIAVILVRINDLTKFIPTESTIISANLTLYSMSGCGGSTGNVRTMAVNRLKVGWIEGTGDADAGQAGYANWDGNQSGNSWLGSDFGAQAWDTLEDSQSVTCGTEGLYTWNITNNTMQSILNGSLPNTGWSVRYTTTLTGADAAYWIFKENGTYPYVPHFEILYGEPAAPTSLGISVTEPRNITYYTRHFNLNVIANKTVNTWWYKLDSGSNITFFPNTTFTAAIGYHKITVYANDSSGNMASNTTYFTVDPSTDITPPNVTITSPQNITYYSNNTIPLNVAYDEAINATWYSLLTQGSNSMFQRYKIITPSKSDTETLTDYQLFINISYDSDMRSDFGDVRFYSNLSDESSYLPYCLGSDCATDGTNNKTAAIVNSNYAEGFIRVPIIDGVTQYYMKYGNSTMTYGGNPESIFTFFDDFNGVSVNSTKWIINNGFSVSGGYLSITGSNSWSYLVAGRNGTQGLLLETMIATGSTLDAEFFALAFKNSTDDEGFDFASNVLCTSECNYWNSTVAFASWYVPYTQFINDTRWVTNKDYSVNQFINRTAGLTSYATVNSTRGYAYHTVSQNISQMGISVAAYRGEWKWYFIRERKFHEPQPTYSAGSEIPTYASIINQTFTPNTTISATNGSNHLIVWANDSEQNYGYSDVYFTFSPLASHPPTVNLVNPAENSNYVYPSQPTFTFTATDSYDSILSCTLYINGTPARTNGTVINNTLTSMTSNFTLTGGTRQNDYYWYVNCTDSTPITIQSDIRHLNEYATPTVQILSPNRLYATYLIPLNVSINQPTANYTYNAYNVNTSTGTGNVTFTPNATINLTALGNGQIDLTVYASFYGVVVSSSVSHNIFMIDTDKPLIFLTYPANHSTITGTDITIYGTAENINLSAVTINDTSWGLNLGTPKSWSFRNSNLSYGQHSLLITANDSSSHENYMQLEFTNQAPIPPSPPITGAIPLATNFMLATIMGAGGLITMIALVFTGNPSMKTIIAAMIFLLIVVTLAAQFMAI